MLAACGTPASAPAPAPAPAVTTETAAGKAANLAGSAGPAAAPDLPEPASGLGSQPGWTFQRQAVVAAHPLAAQAGAAILRQGGNALDAAIATHMVLAVVEPQSSGIGGGAFLMLWDGAVLSAWDGRETAPAAVDETLFLQSGGRPLPMRQAQIGGRAVGVPGAVRMLEAAHQFNGRLPWAGLFAPAIRLAENGFAISPRLHTLLAGEPALRGDPIARALFFDADGQPHPVGHHLRNPALAAVLRQIAVQGSAALHEGPVAADIVQRVQTHASNPGRLSSADLAGYQALRREPWCTDWGAHWRVCGMPTPSSGHIALMQILGLTALAGDAAPRAGFADAPDGLPQADWLHRYTEASRLAFADRAQFVADPAFAPAPPGGWHRLLLPEYLAVRAQRIGPRSMGTAPTGNPAIDGAETSGLAPMPEQPAAGTSHLSVADAQGRVVALTTTIEAVFGARLMSDGGTGLPGGFLLNNQLTDFALVPADAQGRPVANRVQSGKRPRSSMSPTIVFDRRDGGGGRPVMALGSALGPIIIHAVARTLWATLEEGMDIQAAINAPNFANLNGPLLLETGRFAAPLMDAMRARGHEVLEVDLATGLHGLQRTPQGWRAGADPRREGHADGD